MAPSFGNLFLSFMLFYFIRGTRPEKVKIVEEPAVYRSGMNNYQPAGSYSPVENKLVARVKPSPVSGPPHLQVLAEKCFSLTHNGYKYEFCPFHNVTQKEQAVRWNAFAGILGVWKEWIIVNNTFQAMLLANGDMCPGEKPRQTKVNLRCGNRNKVLSVVEPTMCQYELRFETPLACPIDAFLVYPVLSKEGKTEWEEIEEAFYREELTTQGYSKYRRRLFQKENFIPQDKSDEEIQKEDKKVSEAVEKVLSSNTLNSDAQGIRTLFKSKDECSKAYDDLLAEVHRLRKQLSTGSHLRGDNTTELAPSDNGLLQPPNVLADFKRPYLRSNVKEPVEFKNGSDLPATLKGEEVNRIPKETTSELTTHDKNNLRGDRGVLLNPIMQSNERTERKPVIGKLSKRGEF